MWQLWKVRGGPAWDGEMPNGDGVYYDVLCRSCGAVVHGAWTSTIRCKPCAKKRAYRNWRARYAVKKALDTGRLVRPASCQSCAKECKPHAHHFAGYKVRHRLDVVWLCARCHRWAHFRKGDPRRLEVA